MPSPLRKPPRILAIAGSDSGGGAGIQADIKTITRLGGHAMTAITAITAQDTLGVKAIHPIPAEMVLAQIEVVAADIGIDAIKIGMIGSAEAAQAIAGALDALEGVPVVFDPVMVATSGDRLASSETIARFEPLMARSTLITPNCDELRVLSGRGIASEDEIGEAARAIVAEFGCAVLATGWQSPREPPELVDLLFAPTRRERFLGTRINTIHDHGTGCTLSSAIASGLGAGLPLADAISRGRAFVRACLLAAPGFGAGHGPMGHAAAEINPDF
ncbi:MAG: bifunctional hydroxymethylpyrimidine kinase/phosphomethylpyrimidine kinase [Sphingomonadaceae bacterium]|nr:bifunctional hydroxymethylpyrimidine kinase/phosphomethylpyrimidine kinase [Sphingomonadaceae bacterium]